MFRGLDQLDDTQQIVVGKVLVSQGYLRGKSIASIRTTDRFTSLHGEQKRGNNETWGFDSRQRRPHYDAAYDSGNQDHNLTGNLRARGRLSASRSSCELKE